MEPVEWDVAAVAVAVVALLFVYAFYYIVHYSVAVPLSQFTILGVNPGHYVEAAILDVVDTVTGWANTVTGVMRGWFNSLRGVPEYIAGALEGFTAEAAQRIVRIVNQDIPAAATYARDAAIGWAQGAKDELTSYIDGLVADLRGGIASIPAQIAPDIDAAATYARDAAIGWAQGAIDQLRGEVESEVAAIDNAIDLTREGAAGEALQARDAAIGWAQGAVEQVRGELLGDIHALDGEISSVISELRAADVAEAAAAAAATAAVATQLTNWLNDCGDPLCNGLSGLAKLIPALSALFEFGAFMAWVEYCVHNPEDAARDTITVAGPIASGTGSAVESAVKFAA